MQIRIQLKSVEVDLIFQAIDSLEDSHPERIKIEKLLDKIRRSLIRRNIKKGEGTA